MRDSNDRRLIGPAVRGFVRDETVIEPLGNAAGRKAAEYQNERNFQAENDNDNKSYRPYKMGERFSAAKILIEDVRIADSADHKNRDRQRNKRQGEDNGAVLNLGKGCIADTEIFDDVLVEKNKAGNYSCRGGGGQT